MSYGKYLFKGKAKEREIEPRRQGGGQTWEGEGSLRTQELESTCLGNVRARCLASGPYKMAGGCQASMGMHESQTGNIWADLGIETICSNRYHKGRAIRHSGPIEGHCCGNWGQGVWP